MKSTGHTPFSCRARLAKALAFAALAAVASASVAAGASKPYYEPIPYYGNNPFLFCTLGVPQDCWAPVNPATGAFVVTNQYCFNAYSAAMYARVCPHAFPNGLTSGLGSKAGAGAGAGAGLGGGALGGGSAGGTGGPGRVKINGVQQTPSSANPKPKVNCGHVYCAPVEVQ